MDGAEGTAAQPSLAFSDFGVVVAAADSAAAGVAAGSREVAFVPDVPADSALLGAVALADSLGLAPSGAVFCGPRLRWITVSKTDFGLSSWALAPEPPSAARQQTSVQSSNSCGVDAAGDACRFAPAFDGSSNTFMEFKVVRATRYETCFIN